MAGKNRFLGSVFWGFKKTKIFKIQKFSFLGFLKSFFLIFTFLSQQDASLSCFSGKFD